MNNEIKDTEYNPHVGALLDPNGTFTQYGITLLDHYAGLAMQTLLSQDRQSAYDVLATESYKVADALLKARKEINS